MAVPFERERVEEDIREILLAYGKRDPGRLEAFKERHKSKNINTNDVRGMTYDMLFDFAVTYDLTIREVFRICGISFYPLEEPEKSFLELAEQADHSRFPALRASMERLLPEPWQSFNETTPSKRIKGYAKQALPKGRRKFQNEYLKKAWEDRTGSTTIPTRELPAAAKELGIPMNWVLNAGMPTYIYSEDSEVEDLLAIFALLQPYLKQTVLEGIKLL